VPLSRVTGGRSGYGVHRRMHRRGGVLPEGERSEGLRTGAAGLLAELAKIRVVVRAGWCARHSRSPRGTCAPGYRSGSADRAAVRFLYLDHHEPISFSDDARYDRAPGRPRVRGWPTHEEIGRTSAQLPLLADGGPGRSDRPSITLSLSATRRQRRARSRSRVRRSH